MVALRKVSGPAEEGVSEELGFQRLVPVAEVTEFSVNNFRA